MTFFVCSLFLFGKNLYMVIYEYTEAWKAYKKIEISKFTKNDLELC